MFSEAWIGLPCSSWIWMSRGTTRRSRLRVRGCRRLSKVRAANRMVRRVCYLLEYLRKKECTWTIEQPRSSLVPYYHPLEASCPRFCTLFLRRFCGVTERSLPTWTCVTMVVERSVLPFACASTTFLPKETYHVDDDGFLGSSLLKRCLVP